MAHDEHRSDADAVFLKLNRNYFAWGLGKKSRELFASNAFRPDARFAWDRIVQEAQLLPIEEKCRLAVMAWFALPFDGEYAERFGELFGAEKRQVAVRLRRIPDSELEQICVHMGYPELRIVGFKRMVAQMRSEERPRQKAER